MRPWVDEQRGQRRGFGKRSREALERLRDLVSLAANQPCPARPDSPHPAPAYVVGRMNEVLAANRPDRRPSRRGVPGDARQPRPLNGCVYRASVHARRFTQLHRDAGPAEAILTHGAHGAHADTGTARHRAVTDFAVRLTREPNQPLDLAALRRDTGLDDTEILDLIHVVAVFVWANRLMLPLGEPRTTVEEHTA